MSEQNHLVPVKVYLAVFLALIALTAVTVLAAYIDLGFLNMPVALAIAVVKATLVVLYFMHVLYESRLIWLYLAGSVAWLVVLIGITLADYFSRTWLPFPGK